MKRFLFVCCIISILTIGSGVPVVYADTVQLVNPIGGTTNRPQGVTDVPTLGGIVITAALGIMGSLALISFVVGAFLWVTSAGSSDKIKKGGQVMMASAIGIFIVFGAYAILTAVLTAITG